MNKHMKAWAGRTDSDLLRSIRHS